MAHKALDAYLNDHLGGATTGADLAEQVRDQAKGTPLGETMKTLSADIRADRETLAAIMTKLGTVESPIKQVGAWVFDKVGRAKFSGLTTGDAELGTFLALETLALGVAGKGCLWRALREIKHEHSVLANVDLDELIERADSQRKALEGERLQAARRALAKEAGPVTA